MKTLRLLNKKSLSIILTLFFGLVVYAEEQPVDIWNTDVIEVEKNSSITESTDTNNYELESNSETDIYKMQSPKKK